MCVPQYLVSINIIWPASILLSIRFLHVVRTELPREEKSIAGSMGPQASVLFKFFLSLSNFWSQCSIPNTMTTDSLPFSLHSPWRQPFAFPHLNGIYAQRPVTHSITKGTFCFHSPSLKHSTSLTTFSLDYYVLAFLDDSSSCYLGWGNAWGSVFCTPLSWERGIVTSQNLSPVQSGRNTGLRATSCRDRFDLRKKCWNTKQGVQIKVGRQSLWQNNVWNDSLNW
jgi:hypothetical protein